MLYIRTDANKEIAAGHVMRCIAIAKALRNFEEDSVFIVSELEAANIIRENGFRYILIDGRWNILDNEVDSLNILIKQKHIKKILIDSYFITENYLECISEDVYLIYLGSLRKRFSRINLLINYSNTYDDLFYEENYRNKGIKTLLGVKYAPLRKEFQNLKPIISNSVKKIMITTGSTDKDNITFKILKYLLSDKNFSQIEIHVVIGALNNNFDEISELSFNYNNIFIHPNVKNMASLIRNNQLVISASGTTLYELCACGVPSVSFSIVKEQERDGLKFSEYGIIPYAGSFKDINTTKTTLRKIKEILTHYIKNSDTRHQTAINMNNYIDGNGSIRIAKEIFYLDKEAQR